MYDLIKMRAGLSLTLLNTQNQVDQYHFYYLIIFILEE